MRRSDRFALGLTAAALLAGLLLVFSEFSTIASVDVASGSCEVINDSDPELANRCELSGLERHGGALLLIGILVLLMGWGAGVGASRPAALALIAGGLIVLGIAFLSDLPETGETGAIGRNFEGATGQKGLGLYLEIAGGALAIAAGVARMLRPRED